MTSFFMVSNEYTRLRELELAKSTKVFSAKGKNVKRCPGCQLADYACICPWRPSSRSNIDFVLLMHRKELFKPTNTGRLIADVFPASRAFVWNRLEAPGGFKQLLNDASRECYLVFPCQSNEKKPRRIVRALPQSEKKITLILLDGSWKQCSRMIALTRWLDDVPCLNLPDHLVRSYLVRDSGREDRFSTCEAAISCLSLADECANADLLQHYYRVFNEHYLATRGCYRPTRGESHFSLDRHASTLDLGT